MATYHDQDWGTLPIDDDSYFEAMTLELFQAGLSWRTILHKRPAFRSAFHDFSVARVASYSSQDSARLLTDTGIVRHQQKIEAAIANARTFIVIQGAHGSFRNYLDSLGDDPQVLREALRRQFRFMGPKVAESFLEAVGKLPAPHQPGCWRAGQ